MGAKKILIEVFGEDKSAKKTADAVEERFGSLGRKLDRIGQIAGKSLAIGFAAAGVGALKLGQQASDLAETQSKVAQIFGEDSARALDKFAASADRSIGQSKQGALDAAATFGTFGKSAGLAGNDLVGFSTDMTKLASDMASFGNTSPEQAVEAIGAALRGESEPIRQYGVLLDDATLRNEAMRLGLIKTTKEALTPQQKVLAAQSAILKQTKDQQGDFAKTSDGLANKQRILTARLANMGTELGTKVVPALLKLTDLGMKMADWVSRNSTTTGVLVGVVATLGVGLYAASLAMRAAATASAVWRATMAIATAAQWAFNAALTANPIGLIVVGIAALAAGLVLAYQKSETFRAIVQAAFGAVKTAAVTAFNWIKDHWRLLLGIITGPIGTAVLLVIKHWSSIKAAAGAAVDWIKTKLSSFASTIGSVAGKISRGFKGAFDGLKNAFRSAVNFVIRGWNRLQFKIPGFDPPGPGPKFGGFSLGVPKIGELAKGTDNWRGGPSWVGERGPEILDLPKGSRVLPNRESMAMSSGNGVMIIVNGALDPAAVGRQIREILLRLKRENGIDLGLA